MHSWAVHSQACAFPQKLELICPTGPHGNQVGTSTCNVKFRELSNDMSNRLVKVWGAGPPPPKMSFTNFFQIKFGMFFQKNALDIVQKLFTDESITIEIVPQLKLFGCQCHTFWQEQSSPALDPN